MSGNGGKPPDIVGPDGRQLRSKSAGIVILKVPIGISTPAQQVVSAIAEVTGCNVIVLPMEYEIMMGKIAVEALISIHEAIHQIVENDPGELGGKLK